MSSNSLYHFWLNAPEVSDELKQQMQVMSDDEIDVAFANEPLKFGTAGYRAIYGPGPIYLNEHTYQQLTVAYAKFLIAQHEANEDENKPQQIRVFVGHDNRLDGKKISEHVANILTSFGIEVFLVKNNWMIPTPIISFIVRYLNLDGAINITASHNPKEYNGFKAYNHTGAQINEEQAALISSLLPNAVNNLSKKYQPNFNLIKYIGRDVIEAYYQAITNDLNITSYENFYDPIVITTHHGTGSIYVQDYLESLGHNIIPVMQQCYEDSNFTNSPNMNPEDPESFNLAIELAEQCHAKIAIGFDPDGDRMAVAIKKGKRWYFLTGNEMGILASFYILKHKPLNNRVPVVISTFVSNDLIDRIVNHFNGVVLRTATGFKNIAQAMDKIDEINTTYIVGFEEAVGLNCSLSTREKDGIAAAALVIEMYNFYKQQNQTLIDVLWNRIYQIYGQWYGKTVSIKIPGTNWKQIAESLQTRALNMPSGTSIGNFVIDYVKYNHEASCIEWFLNDNSWIKFRISGTEPKFKIYFNLYFDNDNFEYNYDEYGNIVNQLTKKIQEMIIK